MATDKRSTIDGVIIRNVPEDVSEDVLRAAFAEARSKGLKELEFKQNNAQVTNDFSAQIPEQFGVTAPAQEPTMQDVINQVNRPRDTALGLASTMTTGALGNLGSMPKALGDHISRVVSDYITTGNVDSLKAYESANKMEEQVMSGAESMTYMPNNPVAQQDISKIGNVLTNVGMGVGIPMSSELGAMTAARPNVSAATRENIKQSVNEVTSAYPDAARAVGQSITDAIPESVKNAMPKPSPEKIAKRQSMAEDVKAGEQLGISVLTSDISPPKNPFTKWVQKVGENIPIAGTGKVRETQQQQRVNSVRNLLDEYGVTELEKASDAVMLDLAAKRSEELNKYSGMKKTIVEKLDNEGFVPVNNAITEIDNQIKALESLKTENVKPVISLLSDFKESIQGQKLNNIETLRKQLGESLKNPDLATVRDSLDRSTRPVYRALRNDINEFIKDRSGEQDLIKWNIANKSLENMAGDLRKNSLKSILKAGDATPEVVKKMIFSKNPSDIKALHAGLTESGRANARVAILAKAAESARKGDEISPERFVNELDKLNKSTGIFFNKEERAKLEGLKRTINITRRAGEFAANPPTGAQNFVTLGGMWLTDLLGSAGAATVSGLTLGTVARIYESAPVRNLLLKIPKTKKGSAEEAALLKRLDEEVSKQVKESENNVK